MGIIVGVGTFQMCIRTPFSHKITGAFITVTRIGIMVITKHLTNPSVETLIHRPIRTHKEFVVTIGGATGYFTFEYSVNI